MNKQSNKLAKNSVSNKQNAIYTIVQKYTHRQSH